MVVDEEGWSVVVVDKLLASGEAVVAIVDGEFLVERSCGGFEVERENGGFLMLGDCVGKVVVAGTSERHWLLGMEL